MDVTNTLKNSNNNSYSRSDIAKVLSQYIDISKKSPTKTIRDIAGELNIPKSTLHDWTSKYLADLPLEVIQFFESEVGLKFLQQVLLSAVFVICFIGGRGIRQVQTFLKLSGLDQFIASSLPVLHALVQEVENLIVKFCDAEGKRLSKDMPQKDITACLDETFNNGQMSLVAIDAASNFIITEQHKDKRDAETWEEVIKSELQNFNCNIIQCTSDEGAGIVKYVTDILDVNHSPDLFHIQQDLVKGILRPLSQKIQSVSKSKKSIECKLEKVNKDDKKYSDLNLQLDDLKKELEEYLTNKELAKVAIKNISNSYHLYDLETGIKNTPDSVKNNVNKAFETIELIVNKFDVSYKHTKKIDKSKKLIEKMQSTLSFVFLIINKITAELNLNEDQKKLFEEKLLPGIYLNITYKKLKTKEYRKVVLNKSNELISVFKKSAYWNGSAKEKQVELELKAKYCVQLFQRSSSNVEGRNAYISSYHSGIRGLTSSRLKAFTAIHNYFITDTNDTTPAERFFEQKPRDLFLSVLADISEPKRPRRKAKYTLSTY